MDSIDFDYKVNEQGQEVFTMSENGKPTGECTIELELDELERQQAEYKRIINEFMAKDIKQLNKIEELEQIIAGMKNTRDAKDEAMNDFTVLFNKKCDKIKELEQKIKDYEKTEAKVMFSMLNNDGTPLDERIYKAMAGMAEKIAKLEKDNEQLDMFHVNKKVALASQEQINKEQHEEIMRYQETIKEKEEELKNLYDDIFPRLDKVEKETKESMGPFVYSSKRNRDIITEKDSQIEVLNDKLEKVKKTAARRHARILWCFEEINKLRDTVDSLNSRYSYLLTNAVL